MIPHLFGPVSAEFAREHLAPLRAAGVVRTFGYEPGVDVIISPGHGWADLVGRCPPRPAPQFLALWLPYEVIPPGLWDAPVPLVGLAGDWNLLGHGYRRVAARCDLVLTGRPGVAAFARAGVRHALAANLYGLGRSFLEHPWPAPGASRDIDVLFVGNVHPAVQRERLPWLARLAGLADRHRVVIAAGVFGADYRALLARARVVFNRSARGECNRRAFEAAAAGALLLQERENAELPEYLVPGVEYRAYGADDLERAIDAALADEAGRVRVAMAARGRAPGFAFWRLWERAVRAVEGEWPALAARAAGRGRWPAADRLRVRVALAVGAARPGHDPGLRAAVAGAGRDFGAADAANAAAVAAALAGGPPAAVADGLRAAAGPSAVAAVNLAEALAAAGDAAGALAAARAALAAPAVAAGADPVFFPTGFHALRVEWERAGWAHAGDPVATAAAKTELLRAQARGLFAGLTGEPDDYRAAAQADAFPKARAALGCALARAGRYAEAVAPLAAAVAADPFDRAAARALFRALEDAGDPAGAARLAAERRLLARAAAGLVPPEPWFADAPVAPPGPPDPGPDTRPVSVVWEGDVAGVHSLAVVNRALCDRLARRGHAVSVRAGPDVGAGPLPGGHPAERLIGAPLPARPDVWVRHGWPPDFRRPPTGRLVVILPWEFGSPPRAWVEALATGAVDQVWVPSRFVRDGLVAGGVPDHLVRVVPNGVDPAVFRPGLSPLPLATRKRFRFLFVGGTIPRKGFDLLLAAYARAFTAADDVGLVVKDLGVGTFYRGQTAEAAVAEFRARPGAPAVEYLTADLGEADLARLYAACHCLVHPFRAEGFGLPIAEAMACGLPVIVTDHGPVRDWCDPATAYLVPARVVPLPDRRVGDVETVGDPSLAEPDVASLARRLRHVVAHPEEAAERGRAGCAAVRQRLTWDHAAAAAERLLRDLAAGAGPGRRARVSLTMIVRDEEDNLPACLLSVRDLVDETVVVDTGSTDRTKEVAVALGAKVFDFPWVDDFAAARNAALARATGDWVFWLDADDRVAADDRVRLRALFDRLADENAAYVLKCRCVGDGPGGATVVDHVRLFRNRPDVRWRYRVHEQILGAVRDSGARVVAADAAITHVGYADPAARRRKLGRDLRLLTLEDAGRPDDPFTLFNLGSVLHELGDVAAALPRLERSLALSHPKDSIVRKLYALIAHCHRRLGRAAAALAACAAGRRHYPDDAELLFTEAVVRRDVGDPAGAEACLRRLVDGREPAHFASVVEGLRGHLGRHALAGLYLDADRPAEAAAEWRRALADEPGYLPAHAGLGEVLVRQGRWAELEEHAGAVAGLGAAGAEAAAVLRGRAALARGEPATAYRLTAAALADQPDSLPLRVLRSQAALKAGLAAEAEAALRAVLDLEPAHPEATHNLAVLRGRPS